MNSIIAVFLCVNVLGITPLSEEKTWTSNDKKFTVEASLMSIGKDDVVLKKADGREIQVKTARLSDHDREFISHYATDASGRRLIRQHSLSSVTAVAASVEKNLIAGAGNNEKECQYRVWNMATGEEVVSFQHDRDCERIGCIEFIGKGASLAVAAGDEHRVVLYDTSTWKISRSLEAPFNVLTIAGSADGTLIAGGLGTLEGKSLAIWDVASGKLTRTLTGHAHAVVAVEFANKSPTLAAGTKGEVRLWNATDGKPLKQLSCSSDAAVFRLAFSADDQLLAGAGSDGTIYVWEVGTGELKKKISVGSKQIAFWVGISPDGKTVYGRSSAPLPSGGSGLDALMYLLNSNGIGIWSTGDGTSLGSLFSLTGLPTDTYSAHLTDDGSRLIVSYMGTIDIWSLREHP